ncbi:MAG: hypothetical protein ACK40V_04060 [Anaerolineales bacterium]
MIRKGLSAFFNELQKPYGIVAILFLVWHGIVWWFEIPFTWLGSLFVLGIDLIATFIMLEGLTYFFSQFVLPIQNEKDRREIYTRVREFESGKRGPILFVKNGRVIKHEHENNKRGKGVIVLDTASAVVLRTDTEIVGPVGPGIRFTKANEYIISHTKNGKEEPIGVDLRTQWQFIGPHASDQPLLNPFPISNPKYAIEVERRRKQTVGLTRDGFEISATISIKFNVRRAKKVTPSESGVKSQFRYDPNAVRDVVTRQAMYLDKTENKVIRLEWKELPVHLVVNLWREYIRKVKLEDLFTTSNSMSGLQHIEEMIRQRVCKPEVVVLNEVGRPDVTPRKQGSREYQQLEERGLEITEVRIHNVMFDPEMDKARVEQWNTEWMKLAKREEELLQETQVLVETSARNDAIKKFVKVASQRFDNPLAPRQDIYTTLQNLIEPIKENLLTESRANNDVEAELRKLDEILKWAITNKQDLIQRNAGGEG